jgi:hypothetical protein
MGDSLFRYSTNLIHDNELPFISALLLGQRSVEIYPIRLPCATCANSEEEVFNVVD